MDASFMLTHPASLGINPNSPIGTHQIARRLFNQAHRQGLLRRWLGNLTGRCTALRTISRLPVSRQTSYGQRTVFIPVERIVGSEGRSDDFDNAFNPLKTHILPRWIGIAIARRNGVLLPPVELIRDGDEYYVRDGHHRISVARSLGQLDVEAVIVN